MGATETGTTDAHGGAASQAQSTSVQAGADAYGRLMRTPIVGNLAKRAGLPRPVAIERHRTGAAVIDGKALLGAAEGARLAAALARCLAEIGAPGVARADDPAGAAAKDAGLTLAGATGEHYKALVFDASGIKDSSELVALHRFFHPALGALGRCGRVVVLGTPPEKTDKPASTPRSARSRASCGHSARRSGGAARPRSSSTSARARRTRCTRRFASCYRRAARTCRAR